ncbi:N-acetylaspartate synthetase-like [Trachinotus anak]|uniref:N-acetylaspartate synthetase-like n=1 Tax=Trachinotus anak TaxID=443729 RepID=UPI0039F19C7C
MEQEAQREDDEMCTDVSRRGLQAVAVREFRPADEPQVQLIFNEGLMEMIPDTAFRGLRHHPESLLLYAAVTGLCFVITRSWLVLALLPAAALCGRYFYSRRVIHGYLEQAMSADMGDIQGFYMKSPDSCLWVAVLENRVVGLVAALGQRRSGAAVELQRMSVDRSCRRCGVGVALGRKVLEFAAAHKYSYVVLGTTAYTPAAHRLYLRLGFRCVGVTNGYTTPGTRRSLLQGVFYRVRYHHYSQEVKKITSDGQH